MIKNIYKYKKIKCENVKKTQQTNKTIGSPNRINLSYKTEKLG